jgi:hypothetical protein
MGSASESKDDRAKIAEKHHVRTPDVAWQGLLRGARANGACDDDDDPRYLCQISSMGANLISGRGRRSTKPNSVVAAAHLILVNRSLVRPRTAEPQEGGRGGRRADTFCMFG